MEDKLEPWQKIILDTAIEFEFIKATEFNEALKILMQFKDEEEFYFNCIQKDEPLIKKLIYASQI